MFNTCFQQWPILDNPKHESQKIDNIYFIYETAQINDSGEQKADKRKSGLWLCKTFTLKSLLQLL